MKTRLREHDRLWHLAQRRPPPPVQSPPVPQLIAEPSPRLPIGAADLGERERAQAALQRYRQIAETAALERRRAELAAATAAILTTEITIRARSEVRLETAPELLDGAIEAGGYPFTPGAYLHASDLNAALQGNPAASPPSNAAGHGPAQFKLWFDDTQSPPVQRWWDGSQGVAAAAIDPSNHLWLPLLGGGSTTLPSAATVDLGSVPHSMVTITGSAAISSFGSHLQPGSGKLLLFEDGASLVGGNLILVGGPGGGIVTQPGDMAMAWSLGGGLWRVAYMPIFPISGAEGTLTLSGDVTGSGVTGISTTVVRLQGRPLAPTMPTDTQVLAWSAANNQWQPEAPPSGGGSATVTLVGDVTGSGTGTVPSTVVALQSHAVAPIAPANGQFLAWSAAGNNWQPSAIVDGGNF
jgi:hypothetical protein